MEKGRTVKIATGLKALAMTAICSIPSLRGVNDEAIHSINAKDCHELLPNSRNE